MMVLNTVKTLSLVVDLIFLAVAVFAIIKAPFLKQPLFAGPLGDLVGGDDEDDADYALEDAGGSTDGVVTLADAPFQNVNVNRLRDALYQAVAQQVLDFKPALSTLPTFMSSWIIMIGRMPGSVTALIRDQRPAPSICAAS